MNGSSLGDQEYSEFDPEEDDLGLEDELFSMDQEGSYEELVGAPDLSDDPFEAETFEIHDWQDLFERFPFREAQPGASYQESGYDPDLIDDPEAVKSTPSNGNQGHERSDDGNMPRSSPKRSRKGSIPPESRRDRQIQVLVHQVYRAGVQVGASNVFASPSTGLHLPAGLVSSAELWETRELLTRFAEAARTARSPEGAAGLAACLVPVAMGLFPEVYRGLWPVLPALVSSTCLLAGRLYEHERSRRWIRWFPKVLESTMSQLADEVRLGRPITNKSAARLFTLRVESLLETLVQRRNENPHQPNQNHMGREQSL